MQKNSTGMFMTTNYSLSIEILNIYIFPNIDGLISSSFSSCNLISVILYAIVMSS